MGIFSRRRVGTGRIDHQIEVIDERAEERGYRKYSALRDLEEKAKSDAATATARERKSRGPDRQAARQARLDAENRLRTARQALRRM